LPEWQAFNGNVDVGGGGGGAGGTNLVPAGSTESNGVNSGDGAITIDVS
jgi:hypothetical protein